MSARLASSGNWPSRPFTILVTCRFVGRFPVTQEHGDACALLTNPTKELCYLFISGANFQPFARVSLYISRLIIMSAVVPDWSYSKILDLFQFARDLHVAD